MTKQITTLLAEDLSAVGNISMTEALPILTAFGQRPVPLPTVVLSAQTEGLGLPAKLQTAQWLEQTNQQWQGIDDLRFDQALIGYVGNVAALAALQQLLTTWQPTEVILDPVLGDHGTLYPGLDAKYVTALSSLLELGTVLTPNVTELELLSGVNLEVVDEQHLYQAIQTLNHKLSTPKQIIVTGVKRQDQMGSFWLVNGQLQSYFVKYLPRHFSGAGDAFAAILTGYLGRGLNLSVAVQQTMNTLQLAMNATLTSDYDSGLNLVDVLRLITNGENKE
ncbi:PfkB family carbohydrate kinase [Lentilactobacillus senioris]|uniref:PfkB family carbohydrate kinase n=1 Tax=Lentilactobacillus senioris TaxID=931534 RepID=UPI00228042A4|nr:PfkB family carbohydrate kinase [Lentilactobacillus senioris]MCY9805984.1 PfkB family carbohydrate kinase [Lentilactobacillus senioris]